jgi:hypothetical protein
VHLSGDQDIISNWQDSAFDLRRRQLTLAQPVTQIAIFYQTAAAGILGGRRFKPCR